MNHWNSHSFRRPRFARPGSALHAATRRNPRCYPCPTCKAEDVLTARDRESGYQCDACAALDEGPLGGDFSSSTWEA